MILKTVSRPGLMTSCLALMLSVSLAWGRALSEPARQIPVAHEVDVVVVGGSSAGVAAAVAAAQGGAKVFLAAPRHYLGEDLCAPYRLWLEPGEIPQSALAKAIYEQTDPPAAKGIPFKYTASLIPAKLHADTQPPSLLGDGKWHSAPSQSVQYDGDVTLVAELERERPLKSVTLYVYQRNKEFEVQSLEVFTSLDGKDWQPAGQTKNEALGEGSIEEAALALRMPVSARARQIKVQVRKSAPAKRILLGELVIEAADEPPASTVASRRELVITTPMRVKESLDRALLEAGVPFLYGSFCSDVLLDDQGRAAGVVIVNRAGRQAILAKVVIDATERGYAARLAGAKSSPYPGGTQSLQWVAVGGNPVSAGGAELVKRDETIEIWDRKGNRLPVLVYEVKLPMKDDSFAAWAAAEQWARDLTWNPEVMDMSETPYQTPPDWLTGQATHRGPWPGVEKINLQVFQPRGVERCWVLNGCADVSREAAEEMLRPLASMDLGKRVGAQAAKQAASVRRAGRVHRPAWKGVAESEYEVREIAPETNPRHLEAPKVSLEAGALPVWGEYDVVVVGGGTGGAPAAIGAGRKGSKTLLIEFLHTLGGVGTAGLISQYYYGNRVGFTREVDEGVARLSGQVRVSPGWNPPYKSEWYRAELRRVGVEIWCGTLGAGAVVQNGKVQGVIVATPQGRGVVLAKVVIDATGNADVAAAAGATCRYTDETEVAVQGTGLPPRELGARYTNTDYTFVDETDAYDLWRSLVVGRQKFQKAYDLGQLIDTRERRQIEGDLFLTPMDMMMGRTHPDTVVIAKSNFDTHGYTVHPLFMIRPPDREEIAVRVPYRCLLPRGLDGILVTGLGVSAHRDAIPVIRMQADVQNQGYAAGVAASMISPDGGATRGLDIKALQRHLVEKGNLPESALTETDSFPPSRERMAQAIERLRNEYQDLEVILVDPEAAKPLLRQAYAQADSDGARLVYAHILGMLGDGTGVEALVKTISAMAWDKGWRFTGMGQYGASLSPLDSYLIALGRTKDARGLEPVLEKARQLDEKAEFSHYRAIAMALEQFGDRAAARPLAALLRKPGMMGHAVTRIESALKNNPASGTDTSTRNQALSELVLARALYRCGDFEGLGESILRQYARDLHGHYARHAQAVLKTGGR